MLRLALIQHLSNLAVRIGHRQRAHEQADFWANRLLNAGRRDPDLLLQAIADLAREQSNPPVYFGDRLVSQLQGEGFVLDPVRSWLEHKLGATLPELVQQEERNQAADQVTVANVISSLRHLARLDWREVFEQLSLVDRILAEDPADVYHRMDFGTRDRYRHAIEEMAKWSRRDETDVARAAIEAARQPTPDAPPGAPVHIGHLLAGAGRGPLEQALNCRMPLRERVRRWVKDHPTTIYLGGIGLLTAALTVWPAAALAGTATPWAPAGTAAWWLVVLVLGLLALFSTSEIAIQAANYLVTRLLRPRVLPKMSFQDGIPEEWRTLVVVPMLLHTPPTIAEDLEGLEIRFLGNDDEQLHYALLADFLDAPERVMPEDAMLLQAAIDGITALNQRYGRPKFSLLYRERVWSETEQVWMGWERKRGKLEELNRLLVGVETGLRHVGDPSQIQQVRFVITLDTDTQLPHDAARRLVETLAHPLNRPVMAADGRTVAQGYTIIQPRVSTSLPSTTATRFSRIFTDPVGTDPYTSAVSDVYQDLAGEGSYIGKGIYDVATFHQVLDGRFPDALLLSHDLLEGAYVRAGLASDIELLDQFPGSYVTHFSREHRWIRGDWQIADWCTPWVPVGSRNKRPEAGAQSDGLPSPQPSPAGRGGRERNPLSALNRWKIFDNLRRSVLPAAVVVSLVVAWFVLPAAAGVFALLGALTLLAPPLIQLLDLVLFHPRTAFAMMRRRWGWRQMGGPWLRALIAIAFLPHQALVALIAIWLVWYRRLISRRYLLQWQTFQMAQHTAGNQEHQLLWRMSAIALVALVIAGLVAVFAPPAVIAAAPLLAFWLSSPAIAAWLRVNPSRTTMQAFSAADHLYLRRLARQTWRFFDDFVGPDTNWLPPDNYQDAVRVEVAQRTSPTNIGLWLLATTAAHDFGYLTLDEVIRRGQATMDTLFRLERFEGHLLNWYETRTLAPLPPRYVSTVDSGNLLGNLWALVHTYEELLDRPVIAPTALNGMADTLAEVQAHVAAARLPPDAVRRVEEIIGVLAALLHDPPPEAALLVSRLSSALGPAQELVQFIASPASSELPRGTPYVVSPNPAARPPAAASTVPVSATVEAHYWAAKLLAEIHSWLDIADRYLSWLKPPEEQLSGAATRQPDVTASASPSLRHLASGAPLPAEPVDGEAVSRARWLAGEIVAETEALIRQAEDLADEMNMRFLYDPQRRLFSIGYSVEERRLDASYYDLLASECRLASHIAVARGDVPVEHWLTLGRPYGTAARRRVLLSWSGTMFEYLMPLLLTRRYEHSLLDEGCRTAVEAQIEYGRRHGVPWGVSEAAFAAVDGAGTYQYHAFGVPWLALKRGQEDDLVVAPYAAALALMVAPQAAIRNLHALDRHGARGRYGFYESIDFTRARQPEQRTDSAGFMPASRTGVVVQTHMAHHQGMCLLAIDNVLHDNVLQARFHIDSRIRGVEPLLYERIPVLPRMVQGDVEEEPATRLTAPGTSGFSSRFTGPHSPTPRVQLLSNGNYTVMVTTAGGGYSRWRDVEIARWRADATQDNWGSFFYLRDSDDGTTWSAAYHPLRRTASRYAATFVLDRATFERRDAGILTQTDIVVSLEDDVEVRRLTLVNTSGRTRHLEVTSYVELALAAHNADRAHPAFSKLFVQTEALPEQRALLARRKPRSAHEAPVWAAHVLALEPAAGTTDDAAEAASDTFQFETDRNRFIGRGRSTEDPRALEVPLSNTAGAVLDPIFSLRHTITLDPGERVQLAFVTGAAETRERITEIVEKYRDLRAVERTFELAWGHAQLQPRHLRVSSQDLMRYQQLASFMLYPSARLRAPGGVLRQNRLGQHRLWAHGISGDLPILLVTIGDPRDLDVVREALVAHTFWRLRGFRADLVILNEEAVSYAQPLHQILARLVQAHAQYTGIDQPGGIFLRPARQVPPEDLILLQTVARVILVASRGTLVQQLTAPLQQTQLPASLVPTRRGEEPPSAPLPFMELPFFNGWGGFTPDGREYAIYLGPHTQTPAPWVNVMANPVFGALVSESGPGFVWYGNSQANRLLPWSNDPVSDPAGDAIYIRDEDTGIYWSPTPLPVRELDAYRARHGQGYTVFEHNSHGIGQELTIFVPLGDGSNGDAGESGAGRRPAPGGPGEDVRGAPVRIQRLRLRNGSGYRRRLSATFYAEWVLGGVREESQQHVVTAWDASNGLLLARNAYRPDFGDRVAFAGCSPAAHSHTADRTAFLGRNGTTARPAAMSRRQLAGRTGAGLDPCAALQVVVELDPGEVAELVFLFGEAADATEARDLVRRYGDPEHAEAALHATSGWWDRYLDTVQVETPDLAVNHLLNRWLPYQTLSCRYWARSAFYQSGGAFGFRDQLQDCMAFVHAAPDLARNHILEAAQHQFVEGDVQHWWHPPSGAGVRTRFSDDLLWLPLVTTYYVRTTGDYSILNEVVPFLEGPPLDEDKHETYFVPSISEETATLLEHCRRAIRRGLTAGPHGLPLIGIGDWNDGLSKVGAGGQGESVWLAWFLIAVLEGMAEVLETLASGASGGGKAGRSAATPTEDSPSTGTQEPAEFRRLEEEAASYRSRAKELAGTVEAQAWDGAWYRRAYMDDGTPLGSQESVEMKIDSLPQSWGVISGAAEPARARQAMAAVDDHLVKEEEGLILLFTPPFEHWEIDPGYIKGYPPGVRENGGQYTHGAIWTAMAQARLGNGDRAVHLLRLLNPVEHARTESDVERYTVEPYVVAADVYRLPGHVGRGGWTWYTGSSGWLYRVWLEEVLGFKKLGDTLILDPVLPTAWEHCAIRYRYGRSAYHISIQNPDQINQGVAWIELDGKRLPAHTVPLTNDGVTHQVTVRLGRIAKR
jgi:cyclic beta-1,2-glucan synthetase